MAHARASNAAPSTFTRVTGDTTSKGMMTTSPATSRNLARQYIAQVFGGRGDAAAPTASELGQVDPTATSVRGLLRQQVKKMDYSRFKALQIPCDYLGFIPDVELWQIFTAPYVEKLLGSMNNERAQPYGIQRMAKKICGYPRHKMDTRFLSYRKILAVLLLIEEEEHILEFMELESLDDLGLPLEENNANGNMLLSLGLSLDDTRTQFPFHDAPGWEEQVPTLSMMNGPKESQLLCINGGHISSPSLTDLAEQTADNADPDDVWPKVNPSKDCEPQLVVVKRFGRCSASKPSEPNAFEKEVHLLLRLDRKLADGSCRHVTPLLASWEVPRSAAYGSDSDYFMAYPGSQQNLNDFWRDTPLPTDPEGRLTLVKWMLDQFLGLSKALEILHDFEDTQPELDLQAAKRLGKIPLRPRKVYYEITPETIHYFGPQDGSATGFGRLQISGVSSDDINHLSNPFRRPGQNHAYSPPELQFMLRYFAMAQQSDTWFLGCLFFEFIMWASFGYDHGIVGFRKDRLRYDNIRGTGFSRGHFYTTSGTSTTCIETSDVVMEWARELYQSPLCQCLKDAMTIIFSRMLLPEEEVRFQDMENLSNENFDLSMPRSGPTPQWLIEESYRASCAEVHATFKALCGRDDNYYCGVVRWMCAEGLPNAP